MADREQAARSAQLRTVNFYTKRGEVEWGGMIPDGGPATNPPFRPRFLQNVRFLNGEYAARGGQQLHTQVSNASACITSLFDMAMATRRSLFAFVFGCPGATAPGLAFSILCFDQEQEPTVQAVFYGKATTRNLTGAFFANALYFARDNVFTKFQPIIQAFDETALNTGGTRQDITLFTLPSPFTHVVAMLAFDGKLFAAANGGVGASAVVPFDGTTFGPNDLSAINPVVGFGVFRESLLAGFDGAPNEIRVRAAGAVPGTWATVTPSGGTARWGRQFTGTGSQEAGSGNGAGASYKDHFWLASGTQDVFDYNGTTLTQVAPATTGIAAGSVTVAFAVFNRVLYLLYEAGAAGGNVRIASYNGTTWTPIVIDLTTFFAATLTLANARNLLVYRGTLYALVRTAGVPGSRGRLLYHNPGTLTVWNDLTSGVAAGATDIASAVVF